MTDRDDDLGGDPVCWLDRVCPECGLLLEAEADVCPRCGKVRPREEYRLG